jgi:hypothetical protein
LGAGGGVFHGSDGFSPEPLQLDPVQAEQSEAIREVSGSGGGQGGLGGGALEGHRRRRTEAGGARKLRPKIWVGDVKI